MTLRTRLALLFGGVALAATVLVGVLAYRSTASELTQSTDDFLAQRLDELSSGLRGAPFERLPRRGDDPRAADDDAIIQVTLATGRSASSGPTLPTVDVDNGRLFSDVEVDGERYRMISERRGERLVQVARSVEEDVQVLRTLLRRFVLIAAAAAAAAAAIGWFIATRATSPLRRLASVANDVARTGDLNVELSDVRRTDEIGSLADSFVSMLAALEASQSQQRQLIADAGHELRTPLTSMRANVDLLERARSLPEDDRREVVAAIKSELVELTELFNEVVDLATDHGDQEMALAPVDLIGLAGRVAQRWQRRSDRAIDVVNGEVSSGSSGVGTSGTVLSGTTTSASLPGAVSGSFTVEGDEAMLERAVSNLVSNAVKFSPAGTPVQIVVGTETAADGSQSLVMSVRDGGPGIAPEERDRVFDRFHRSDAARALPGSGLGLSIVQQIVERHRGEVFVNDAPGGGAEVGFRLPGHATA